MPSSPTANSTLATITTRHGWGNTRVRALGTARDRTYPLGMAVRGYFRSPLHDEPWIESHLDIHDKHGKALPGYAWIFPVGDGTINVGVGLLSTFSGWKDINTSHLMEAFVDTAPVLERELAQRAGLGAVGKNTLLIERGIGSYLLLGEIITTLELEPDAPEKNHCGNCTRCVEACPTAALSEKSLLTAPAPTRAITTTS